jgi:hypothetical protein
VVSVYTWILTKIGGLPTREGLKAKDIWRGQQLRTRVGFGKATSSDKVGGQGWVKVGL